VGKRRGNIKSKRKVITITRKERRRLWKKTWKEQKFEGENRSERRRAWRESWGKK
jgi:hypothetical protein